MYKYAGPKLDALKNYGKMLWANKKPAAGALAGAGVIGTGSYYTGKSTGKKETAKKFNEYNQQENRMIANRAYQIGLSQKTASTEYSEIIEAIALEKMANGHGPMFVNSFLSDEVVMNKVAANQYPIGDTGYDFTDLESLEKMAAASSLLSKLKGYGGAAMDKIKASYTPKLGPGSNLAGKIKSTYGKATEGMGKKISDYATVTKHKAKTKALEAGDYLAANKKKAIGAGVGAAGVAGGGAYYGMKD